MTYSHTQRGPVWLILAMFGVASFIGAWFSRGDVPVAITIAAVGVGMFVLSLCFATLTVRDEVHSLSIRFGPVPMFSKRIAYESITSAHAGHSAFIDGWGIHYIPGRGWTYNLWGWSCVQLNVNGRTIRVGSDDAENLARFIQSKIAATA